MGMVQAKAKSVSKNPMIVDDNGAEVDQQIMKIPSEKLNTASIPAPNWASQLPADSPKVFFDIAVNGTVIGRIEMTLAKCIVPKTVANFRTLCLGSESGRSSGKPLQYKGCPFHRIIPNFMCQGGDFTNKNGTGGESIYGKKFADENFKLKHTGPGILSMANAGPDTNGSQFFLCTAEASWLDGKHVVFGFVSKGYEVVRRMETYGSQNGSVSANIIIADCGELSV